MYRLLGDEGRLRLLRVLARERLNVTELTGVLGLAQSGVSRHLGLLKDAGLVHEAKAGTRRIYTADAKALGELRVAIDEMWRTALGEFAATLNEKEKPSSPCKSTSGGPEPAVR